MKSFLLWCTGLENSERNALAGLVLGLISLPAVFISLWILRDTLDATKAAADAATASAEAARQDLVISAQQFRVETMPALRVDAAPEDRAKEGEPFLVTVRISSVGKGPARHVQVAAAAMIVAGEFSGPCVDDSAPVGDMPVDTWASIKVASPEPIPHDDFPQYPYAWGGNAFVWGTIRYENMSGESEIFLFCKVWNPSVGFRPIRPNCGRF
jgi:hypothetical protein